MGLDLFEDFAMLTVRKMVWSCRELKDYQRLFKITIERFKILKALILPVGNNPIQFFTQLAHRIRFRY
ncbi:MAG: hypothetical protein OET21_16205, partial [Desulfobacterales bacterium]|nr:hypothetical protein [Desulfobacterales bacterium]